MCDDTQEICYGGDRRFQSVSNCIRNPEDAQDGIDVNPRDSRCTQDQAVSSFDGMLDDEWLRTVEEEIPGAAVEDIASDDEVEEGPWNPEWNDYPSDEEDDEDHSTPNINSSQSPEDKTLPMFASSVTLDGIRVTIKSLIDLVDFLLDKFPYVLTEKFCQDILEVYPIIK